ncbi:MAG: helix-turn-helix domain-containing protein, partial [Chloroflexia bacterium]
MDQIPGIAAKYRDIDADDLAAELKVALLELRRNPAPHVRDWKPYLVKSLLHLASRLARQWRRLRVLESSLDSAPFEPAAPILPDSTHRRERAYRRLGNSDRRLLSQLASCDWKVSRVAKLRGQHRNTIHRRLREIRRTRALFEIESAPPATGPPNQFDRSQLEALIQSPSASARQVLRARLILDLFDGLTYEEILRRRGTSASTIARWRERFEKSGMAGLNARHPGRKPSRRSRRSRFGDS